MQLTLLEAAKAKTFGMLSKHENFFQEYDFNFKDFRDKKDLRILEVGVQGGGSLGMWRQYFDDPLVVGMDIDPACLKWQRERVRICIGDQENEETLRRVEQEYGPFDIVVDDGGHTMKQQLVTFETLFPLLIPGGMYVIEDLHTSYWPQFGGRKGKRATAIGYLKYLIDEMHFEYSKHPRANLYYRIKHKWKPFRIGPSTIFQQEVRSVYVADSIAFIRKATDRKDRLLKF